MPNHYFNSSTKGDASLHQGPIAAMLRQSAMKGSRHLAYLFGGAISGLTTAFIFALNDNRWWATGHGLIAGSVPVILTTGLVSITRSECERKLDWKCKENIPLTELIEARDKHTDYTIFSLAIHATYANLFLLGFYLGAVLSAHGCAG